MRCALHHGMRTLDDVIISFFFNFRGEQLEKSVEGLYRSLLYQLLDRIPRLMEAIPTLREIQSSLIDWSVESLKDMFYQAVWSLDSTEVTCYVDAIDECDEDNARELIGFFETLGESAVEAGIGFRALFSSRHYPNITMWNCQYMTIEGQEGHARDISNYVDSKLRTRISKQGPSIQSTITTRASGVFLWVILVVRHLNVAWDRGQIHQLERIVQAVSINMRNLFDDILHRSLDGHESLLITLQWTIYARRPLKREELYFAILAGLKDSDLTAWEKHIDGVSSIEKFLLSSSHGFAEVTTSGTVRFIHESADHYLRDTGLRTLDPSLDGNTQALCNDRLKECCHRYVSVSFSRSKSLYTARTHDLNSISSCDPEEFTTWYPFLRYALDGMLYHASAAQSAGSSQSIYVQNFPLSDWIRLHNILEPSDSHISADTATRAYIFALSGAHSLLEVLSQDTFANHEWSLDFSKEQHRSLLGAAVHSRDLKTVELVLGQGVSANSQGKNELSSLSLAIGMSDADMIRSLLAAGASIRARRSATNELHTACSWANAEIAQMLLDKRPDVNVEDEKGQTAMHHAASRGRLEIVQLLLDSRADTSIRDNNGSTALECATREGHQEVVQALLNAR